jgi:hypothetical protein
MEWWNIGMMGKELERNNGIMQPWMGRGDFSLPARSVSAKAGRPFEGRLKPPLPDVVRIFHYSGSKTND